MPKKQLKKRRCKWCGHWFQPTTTRAKFCQRKCKENSRNNLLCLKRRRCERCGHWFQPTCERAKYCSRGCGAISHQQICKNRRRQISLSLKNRRCEGCNRWFKPKTKRARFCSQRCHGLTRHRKIKEACVAYKGGKCQKCGYDRCVAALDFHHRRPDKKEFRVSGNTWSVKLRKELDKCDLLCANCHREAHN